MNPDCTVRACYMPRLFRAIFAKRLNPAVVASVDCMSSTSEVTPTIDEHDTNMDGYVTNLLEHLPNLNETGIGPDEHVTNLVSRWSSIPRAWHYLCRKRDNGSDHRAGTMILQAEKPARKPGFACITLLCCVYRATNSSTVVIQDSSSCHKVP